MLEKMQFFTENWYIIVTFICAMILAISKIIEFIGYPTAKKKQEIKDRLLIYVTEAEIMLGSKTGEIKLSQVYDEFCASFPYIKKWLTLDEFKCMVDDVLPTMREILEQKNKLSEV